MLNRRVIALAAVAAGTPPTEFRLFTAGWNDTENGRYLFDEEAATATMAAYKKWGVDLAIDLEHQMLEPEIAPDPTAKDARGWCNLELRSDGSLWAVNVKWTADGATRLSEKRQRYISPAFSVDPETSRVVAIVNVAITAIPATHDTPALVAASRTRGARDLRKLSTGIAFGDVQTALGAALAEMYPTPPGEMCSPSGPWVCDVFDTTVVYQKDGDYFEAPYTFDGAKASIGAAVQVTRTYVPVEAPPAAAPPPAAPATNKKRTAKLAVAGENAMTLEEFMKVIKALGLDPTMSLEDAMAKIKGEAPAADPDAATEDAPPPAGDGGADETTEAAAAPPPPAPAAGDKEDKETVAASIARLTRITGKPTIAASVEEVEIWHKSHVELEERTAKLAKEQAAIELGRRKENAKKLVELGAETPHTSGLATFVKDGKAVIGKLAKRLLDEPLDEQTARVTALLAARGGKMPSLPTPPAATNGGAPVAGEQDVTLPSGAVVTLSAREVARCAAKKIDLVKYAEQREAIKARSAPTQTTGADR